MLITTARQQVGQRLNAGEMPAINIQMPEIHP